MQYIPFGKFFDTQVDRELISSFKFIQTYELDPHTGDTIYLFTSNITNDSYIVVDAYHGADWGQVENWTHEVLQDQSAKLEEIQPKNPDSYADSYYLFRIIH